MVIARRVLARRVGEVAALGVLFFALVAVLFAARPALAQPEIRSVVTDQVGALTEGEKRAVERLAVRHREETGVQIAVLLIKTTRGEAIEDYALRAAEAWGGGNRGADDGVLVVLAIDDRRMRIEVGYGLEPYLTDARCKRILDGWRGSLRDKRYGIAVDGIVREIIAETRRITPNQSLARKPDRLAEVSFLDSYVLAWFGGLAVAFVGVVLVPLARRRRTMLRALRGEVTLPVDEHGRLEPPWHLPPAAARLAGALLVAGVVAHALVGATVFFWGYAIVGIAGAGAVELAAFIKRRAASAAFPGLRLDPSPWVIGAALGVAPFGAAQFDGDVPSDALVALGVHCILAVLIPVAGRILWGVRARLRVGGLVDRGLARQLRRLGVELVRVVFVERLVVVEQLV